MALSCFMFLTLLIQLMLACVRAEGLCKNEFIKSINISTVQQSDVLLPSIFKPALLGSDTTADIAVVWTHKKTPEDRPGTSLLEISLQGGVWIWNNRGGRINTFPKLSASGNFSILLHKVNKSDLGLYRCELFKGTNCRLAYQELLLSFRDSPEAGGLKTVLITAAALGGGIVLLSLMIIRWFCTKYISHTLENPIYDM